MSKFYFLLWLEWIIRVTLSSFGWALVIAFSLTTIIYFNQNMPTLTDELINALFSIGYFWFKIIWIFTLLVTLFRSVKYLFNRKIGGYELKLSDCKYTQNIEVIGYGDLVKVWRKWFFLLIWLVVVEMILSTVVLYTLVYNESIFAWFNIYWLFIAILIAGYFSFILLSNRCKRVKIIASK